MSNNYFQTLPEETQQELGKSAFDAFLNYPPPFAFKGKWSGASPEIKARWMAVVEAIFNQLQGLEETVTSKLEAFNTLQDILNDATEEFESIRPDEISNNYQLYETLRSRLSEVDNARLRMLRANNEAGNVNSSSDETTASVTIHNVRRSE